MNAASASILGAGESPAVGTGSEPTAAMPHGAILTLRGSAIGLALIFLSALAAVAITSLTVGYPIGRPA